MGSFTEVVLSLSFRLETPEEVLAAFSGCARPVPADSWCLPERPLPPPVVEIDDEWSPDYEDAFGVPDPRGETPWVHEWSRWLRSSASITTVPDAALDWSEMGRWYLSFRCAWKADPAVCFAALRWLAPYIDDFSTPGLDDGLPPTLLGHLKYDGSLKPALVWLHGREMVLEDLQTDDDWEAGYGFEPGELVVVTGESSSGRDARVDELAAENPEWLVCRDFQSDALDDDPAPQCSRAYGAAVRALQRGDTVLISDARYADAYELGAAVRSLTSRAPFVNVRTLVVPTPDDQ